jgi:SNF2 family DNA or RNA helicase
MIPNHRIYLEGNDLVIAFPLYEMGLIERAKDLPSVTFDRQHKLWKVPKEYFAAVMSQFPGFAASNEVEEIYTRYKEREKKFKCKNGLTFDFNKPVKDINGSPLFKHQIEGIKFILNHRRVLLCDEMGLGKTRTALIAAQTTNLPIYVIAPKSLHINWMREAYIVGIHIKKLISWAKVPPAPDEDCFVIMDEAHALQSMWSKRTNKALDFCWNAPYVVAITGTPIKNGRPSNLFGLLCAIKHPLSFQRKTYEKLYCGASATNRKNSKTDRKGATNLTTLHERISNSILLRRKSDCLDLPAKIRTLRIAELTGNTALTYNEVFNSLRTTWLAKNVGMKHIDKMNIFGQLRQAASYAKIYEAKKIAEELNENNLQAVFFVAYVGPANLLQEELNKIAPCGLLTGEISVDKRQSRIDSFQNGNNRFMVATYGVGGFGFNFTAAHHCVLVDRGYTPADALQAEDRLHRIGQKDTVICTWLQCNNTDQHIDKMLLDKQKNISSVLTGDSNELTITFDIRDHIDELFKEVFK